jgi:hypothetical protein
MWKTRMLDDAHQMHLSDLVHKPHIARARDIRVSTRDRQKKVAAKRVKEGRPTGVALSATNAQVAAEAVVRRAERQAAANISKQRGEGDHAMASSQGALQARVQV